MPERDRTALTQTYAGVLNQVNALSAVMQAALEEHPVEEFPRHGTYIKCIDSGLRSVAAMAELCLENVGDEAPQPMSAVELARENAAPNEEYLTIPVELGRIQLPPAK